MTKDMTTGSPLKLILHFSIPLLIGNIFQQFYSMVDAIIVGRFIGVKALAAVGSTGAMFFLVMGFTLGITSGFSIIVAQRFGANDKDGLRHSVATSIILCVIITIIITAISMVTARPLLNLMNTPADIINDATSYITILYAGIVTTVFYNMISSILRALGDSRTPLYFLIVASILNVILDIFLIVYLSMEVSGAAYATIISQGISGLLCLIYTSKRYKILKLQKKDWKFDLSFTLEHLRIGIPMALQFSVTAIGVIILQGALNAFGSTLIAAYTAAMKVEQLVMQPSISFGVTMATFAGQNLGAGKIHRIKDGVKKCSYISLITNIFAGIVVFLFGRNFTKLFISGAEAEVIESAQRYLNIVAVFFVILGLLFIYRNTLQGIGEAFVPMLAGAAELLVRVIVAFTLPGILGYTGICLASPIAWIAATIPLAIAYFSKINKLLSMKNEKLNLSQTQ